MITYDYYLCYDSDGLVSSLSRFVDCRELSIAQFLITSAHLQLFLGRRFGRRLLIKPLDSLPGKRLTQPCSPVFFRAAFVEMLLWGSLAVAAPLGGEFLWWASETFSVVGRNKSRISGRIKRNHNSFIESKLRFYRDNP